MSNYIPNPSFEVDTTGWAATTNCTIARTTAQALLGVASLQMTATAAANMRASSLGGTNGFPVTPGLSYRVQAYSRAATVARSWAPELHWYTSAGVFISSDFFTAAANTTTGWTRLSRAAAAPATAAYGQVGLRVEAPAAGEVHYMDAILAVDGSQTLRFSMNRLAGTLSESGVPTLDAQGAANVWAGTTNLDLVGALNVKAANTLPNYRELAGVLNQLAGKTDPSTFLEVDGAAALIP